MVELVMERVNGVGEEEESEEKIAGRPEEVEDILIEEKFMNERERERRVEAVSSLDERV